MTLSHPTYQSAVNELIAHGYRPARDEGLATWSNESGSEYLIGIAPDGSRELVKLA